MRSYPPMIHVGGSWNRPLGWPTHEHAIVWAYPDAGVTYMKTIIIKNINALRA
jgi:hypothetical protein